MWSDVVIPQKTCANLETDPVTSLTCSTFCKCEGGINCKNPYKAKTRNEEDEEEHVGEK